MKKLTKIEALRKSLDQWNQIKQEVKDLNYDVDMSQFLFIKETKYTDLGGDWDININNCFLCDYVTYETPGAYEWFKAYLGDDSLLQADLKEVDLDCSKCPVNWSNEKSIQCTTIDKCYYPTNLFGRLLNDLLNKNKKEFIMDINYMIKLLWKTYKEVINGDLNEKHKCFKEKQNNKLSKLHVT